MIITAEGMEYFVRGILSSEYIDIDSGMASVAGDNPVFERAEEDIVGVAYDDFLTLNRTDYRIKGVKPYGTQKDY